MTNVTFPQANYQALTLANSLISSWSLTGLLALNTGVQSNVTEEGVWIYGHATPPGTQPRIAILVRKVSPLENVIEHPKFDEVVDTYEVWCQYTLESLEEVTWSNAESLVELMESEVLRIIKLSYDPATTTGTYFRTDRKWDNRDDFDDATQRLNRVLTISLIKLRSRTTAVAVGYGGILVFNVALSDGSNLPGTNYQFTEAYHVEMDEGWDTIEEIVTGNPYGQGVPIHFTSKFSGMFQCQIYAKFGDIGTSGNMLNVMNQILTTGSYQGELPRVYFIQTAGNTAGPPSQTLTDNVAVKITRFTRTYDVEQLVGFRIQGKMFRPSTMSFS